MDSFRKRNLKEYWDMSEEFINFIKDHSSLEDVEEIDDMLLFLKNVCLTNDAKMVQNGPTTVQNDLKLA